MTEKIIKAGKSSKLFLISASIFLILFVVLMVFYKGLSILLVTPLVLAIFYLYRYFRLRKKPIFIVSENEIKVFNPLKTIAVEKIEAVRPEGEGKLELILKDELPVPLLMHELSTADRKELKLTIEKLIGQKTS